MPPSKCQILCHIIRKIGLYLVLLQGMVFTAVARFIRVKCNFSRMFYMSSYMKTIGFSLAAVLIVNGLIFRYICWAESDKSYQDGTVGVFPLAHNRTSIVYHGEISRMVEHWASRTAVYRLNVLTVTGNHVDSLVQTAIRYNSGAIRKSMGISYIGSPLVGGRGIRSWFSCPTVLISYMIISRDEGKVITWSAINENEAVTLSEGQYPMDSMIFISAGSLFGKWYQLYWGNIQAWTERGLDLYIRGTESRTGRGVAYISYNHDDSASYCLCTAPQGILNFTQWDSQTQATFQRRSSRHPAHAVAFIKSFT